MDAWSLTETKSLIRRAFGRDQERLANDSLRSIQDRQAFGAFHFHEAIRLHKQFERKHLSGKMLLDLHSQDGQAASTAFEVFMVKAGAHALAAIQSVHAAPDILAHALYFATAQNMGTKPLKDRFIAAQAVSELLSRTTQFRTLGSILAKAYDGTGWGHLSAVCNTSKHRSVVRASLNEDWTGKRKSFRQLHIAAFAREGITYTSIAFEELVSKEYDRLSLITVEAGHELNTQLRAIAT